MPLDPQVKAFLEELASLDVPPLSSLTPQQARAQLVDVSALLGDPEPVAKIEDHRVEGPQGKIPVRIYTPRGSGPLPVLVFYHGGGWVLGDISTYQSYCTAVTNAAGCIVVAVDYRRAPEHKYPAAADDAFTAAAWVFDHAASFGGDPDRIALGGDSAGGNLTAVVSLMARDRSAFKPVAQVLIYPVTDFNFDTPSYRENAEGYMLTRDDMQWFWNCYLNSEEDGRQPYASPLKAANLSGLPPALVITAEYDPLRDEGEAYAARLRQAGVPVTLTRYDGMIHAFVRRLLIFDKARDALKQVADALKQAFA